MPNERIEEGPEVRWAFRVWPNMAVALTDDLRWLVENQAAIVAARGARKMMVPRPILVWPDGKVRVEFVKTYPSAKDAVADLRPLVDGGAPKPEQACDHWERTPSGCRECAELEREYPTDAECEVCERMTPAVQLRQNDGSCWICAADEEAHMNWESHEFGAN